jgi:2-amino-4-hydroxy-6-hydroxymethyldihydropteridine diphosphokinase
MTLLALRALSENGCISLGTVGKPEAMNDKHRIVYVGFGANIGNPLDTYSQAKVLLQSKLGPLYKESFMYESGALTLEGTESQTNYFNAVLAFVTALSPHDLLSVLLETERQFKRTRNEAARWAPRPIDLDVLFVGDSVIQEDGLTIPHPELHKRDFVLRPLVDIAPDLIHPLLRETIVSLESSLEARGYKRLIIRRCAGLTDQTPASVEPHCVPEDRELPQTERPLPL